MDEIETIDVEQDPVDLIQELRDNSVPKAEFDKLKAQNTKLLKALANGEKIENKPAVDVDALRRELFGDDRKPMNNVQIASKMMELREALIDAGEADPFLPSGHQVAPTNDDVEAANRVAEIFKECLDYARGDNAVFTNELQRRTLDVRIKH